MRTGELGFWWRSLGGPPPLRPALEGSLEVDVAIVGAGYTGLWTAYYLKRADPSLSVAIVEAQRSGFGASARNGGWLTSSFSGPARAYERRAGSGAYVALQRAMFDTIDEVASVLARERIEADLIKGGHLSVALDAAQAEHLTDHVRELRALGVGEADLSELRGEELAQRVRVAGARAAVFSPHAARIHPAKLVAGLAQAVERLGVTIYEQTPVSEIRRHLARSPRGDVRARWIVRATEGYTRSLRGMRRELAPINSSMIVTEPLGADVWQEIGWRGCEVLDDAAHVFVYLQRTDDGRIAIGGRGVPYRFASRTDGEGATAAATVDSLRAKLHAMFPATRDAAIDHAWSGVLGVTRDWCVSIGADYDSGDDAGLAWAGGYAGEGVAAANLAGRIVRDLLLDGRPFDRPGPPLSELAWVGRRVRPWEPEPLRWAGIRGVYSLYRQADRIERRAGRASRLGRLVDAVSGR
ncbi:MAG: NAD(P)/FAD-dependent oxidoreductase [Solirubrobacteraceae bacterium]